MAEWLILKLRLEEKLEGGQRLEQGASLGLFPPSTVEARDRSTGLLSSLPMSLLFNTLSRFVFLHHHNNLRKV